MADTNTYSYLSPRAASLMALADGMRAEKETRRVRLEERLDKYVGATGALGATVGYLAAGIPGAAVGGTLLSRPLYGHTKAAGTTILKSLRNGISYIGKGVKEGIKVAVDATAKGIDIYTAATEYREVERQFYERQNRAAEASNGAINTRINARERYAQEVAEARTEAETAKTAYTQARKEAKRIKSLKKAIREKRVCTETIPEVEELLGLQENKRATRDAYASANREYHELKGRDLRTGNLLQRMTGAVVDSKRMKKLEEGIAQAQALGLKDINSTQKLYALMNGTPAEYKAIFPEKEKKSKISFAIDPATGKINLDIKENASPEERSEFFQYYGKMQEMENAMGKQDRKETVMEALNSLAMLERFYRSACHYKNAPMAEQILEILRKAYGFHNGTAGANAGTASA